MSTVIDAHRNKFANDPDDRRAFEALEEQYFLDGAWDALADLYRTRIDAPSVTGDVTLQSPLLFRLGQILEERTLDIEGACEVYWRLAKLDAANRPALRQLRGIYEQREQWDMVLQIAEIESQTEMPAYDRAAFEAEMAVYWKEHLQDAEEARQAFERALVADPVCPQALEGLAQLHVDAGRHAEAAELLETLTGRLRGPERAPVWTALGQLYAGSLDQRRRAADCFARALEDDPFMISSVEWSLLLETEFENWSAVSDLLERRFDLAAGARHRAAIAVEASHLQLNQLESVPAARAWIDRACELASEDPSVLLARADVERAERDEDALATTLEEVREVLGSQTPRPVLLESAGLHAKNGRSEIALELVRLASEKPGSDDAEFLTLQASLFRDSGAKRELAEILETLNALDAYRDNPERLASLQELAQLHEDEFADDELARSTWQRAFDLDPTNDDSLNALERLQRKLNDLPALVSTFEQALQTRGPASDPSIRLRLAQLQLETESGSDWEAAQRQFESILETDPTHRDALTGLRTIAERNDDADLMVSVCEREATGCEDPSEMGRLAAICIPVLSEKERYEDALGWADRWEELAPNSLEALRWKAEFEERLDRPEAELVSLAALEQLQSGAERAGTLRRKAALLDRSGEAEACAAALEESLREEPLHQESLIQLAQLQRDAGRSEALVETLRGLADALPVLEQAPILEELAQLLHDPIGDLDAAVAVRERIMDLPNAPEPAAASLESLLESAGRHAELVRRLEIRRATMADDSLESLSLDLRRSQLLLDALGQHEAAAEILSVLFDQYPSKTSVTDLFERALRSGSDFRGLCKLLERREQNESDPTRRAAILFERAGILEQELSEPLEACALYEELAREETASGRAPIARARLEALLEAEGEWSRLRDLLLARLDSLEEHQRPAQRERIASLCRDRLNDIEGCAEQLEAITDTSPAEPHIWQQLEEIYRVDLERPNDWLRVMQAEIEAGTTLSRELTLRISAARLLSDDDRRPPNRVCSEAVEHYERVLELDSSHVEANYFLAEHYSKTGRPEETRRILENRLAQIPSEEREEISALRVRLGQLLCGELDDADAAIAHFEGADESDLLSPAIAESLATLYEQQERFGPLASLSWKVIEGQRPGEESPVWRLRHARSARANGDLTLAAASYRVVLDATPSDQEVEDELIALYEEQGDFGSLSARLTHRLESMTPDERVPLRLRLAEIQAESLGDIAAGLSELEAVLASHPDHHEAFTRALALAERLDDPDRTRPLLERGLEAATNTTERAHLLERRGRLLADRLDDPEAALSDLREAVTLDPNRTEARRLLRRQLERLERWPAVLDCLYLEFGQTQGAERDAICEEAAQIAERSVSADAALPWLARLREQRPEDPEIVSRIGAIHRAAGRFDATLRALDDEISLRGEGGDRCRLLIQRAELLERELTSPGRAVLAYQQALDENPTEEVQERILVELDRLYAQLDRPIDRARVLETRAKRRSGVEGVEMRTLLASIYTAELGKPALAVAPLLRNIEALRGDPAAELLQLSALDRALRRRGQSEAWARMAERALELMRAQDSAGHKTTGKDRAYLQDELARVYDEDLGRPLRAIEHLRVISSEHGDPVAREQRLRQLLRRTDRPAELARRIQSHLQEGTGQGRDWLELGQLREERQLDLRGALQAFREAAKDPEVTLEAIRGQRRCAERLRDWETLASALDLETEQSDRLSPLERSAAARKLGEICWQRLGSADRATQAYEKSLVLEPSHVEAVRALTRIRETSSDTEETQALYHRELGLLGSRPADLTRAREIWLKVAASLTGSPERERETLEAYQSAARIERLSPADELRMARLHDALGESDLFCDVFAAWCDRDDGVAEARDHLELAERLADRGRAEDALARAARAAEAAPENADAWATLARLERAAGNRQAAAKAFLRAADHADARVGSDFCIEASLCLEKDSLTDACDALARAVDLDPSSLVGHTALTRGSAAIGDDDRTWREADRTLELAELGSIPDETRHEICLLGGRAAHRCGERGASRRLYSAALAVQPKDIEALEAIAHSDFEAGDFHTARTHLETRIELEETDPRRGQHLAMIARGLEADHLIDAAWARYDSALECDPKYSPAYEGLARLHERSGRLEHAMQVLEQWAEHETEPEVRGKAALRAGELALQLEMKDRARTQLEQATRLSPANHRAWELLSALIEDTGSESEARAVCEAALAAVEPNAEAAAIALRSARLAEQSGDTNLARERFGEAARWEPSCVDGALGESRLIRGSGDWRGADEVLTRFIASHPNPQNEKLASIHLERGRLLSGPLEDFEAAAEAYGRALELQPDLNAARTALAGLLVHSRERWREALQLNRAALVAEPTNATALRALGKIAEQRGESQVEQAVQALLDALGHSSRHESNERTTRLEFATNSGPPMSNSAFERLRRIAHLLREDASNVLGEIEPPTLDIKDSEVEKVVGEILRAEGELAAPGIGLISGDERRDFFSATAGLLLDPGGNGGHPRYREALDRALGRWSRRKLRRIVDETSIEAIESLDHASWGDELRAMAAGGLLDRGRRSLTVVLRAVLILEQPTTDLNALETGNLETIVADTGSTRRLVSRLTSLLCDRLERSPRTASQ